MYTKIDTPKGRRGILQFEYQSFHQRTERYNPNELLKKGNIKFMFFITIFFIDFNFMLSSYSYKIKFNS